MNPLDSPFIYSPAGALVAVAYILVAVCLLGVFVSERMKQTIPIHYSEALLMLVCVICWPAFVVAFALEKCAAKRKN